jgi:hypothetical protein
MMQKMHHGIGKDNWTEPHSRDISEGEDMEAAMDAREILLKADGARGDLGLLPRSVRVLAGATEALGDGLVEFEVVSGNAAYREGERFFLTPAKARRAYPATPGRDIDAV